jgi:hypothetical protein
LRILQDQNAAEEGRRGLAVRVTSLLRRWCREHYMDEAIKISSETGRYLFRLDVVRRWLPDESHNSIKAGSDKVAAPKSMRPTLVPLQAERAHDASPYRSSSRSAFAALRSGVSNPSVNRS